MNILYFGPYRQHDDYGIQSKLYLDDFSKISNISSRPIYINNEYANKTDELFYSENHQNSFDVLVQHLPISSMAVTHKIKHNICIPIVDNHNLSQSELEKLYYFDKILVDNHYLLHILEQNNIDTNKIIKIKSFKAISDISIKFDLTSHNFTSKLYFIGDYYNNTNLIDNLIMNFLNITKLHRNMSLLLFLYDTNANTIQTLSNKVKEIHQKLNIRNQMISIVPIPIQNEIKSLMTAHNTGDIFLDINEYSKCTLNRHIANQLQKKIIDINPVSLKISPVRNNNYSSNGFFYYSSDDIYKTLSILPDSSISYEDFNHIDAQILC